jgi:hypothetical protein
LQRLTGKSMGTQTTHESFSREETVVRGSERSFGVVIAAALGVLALFNWWHDGKIWPWLAGISVLFIVTGYFCPAALRPLNWLWFKFGLLLHSVVNPIVMGLLFYAAVWPTGLVMRAFGKDLLRLKREPECSSYWIARQPPGPEPETMKDQF